MYFADGRPAGLDALTPLTFTPSFQGVSPNSGVSMGGTLLTVNAPGVVQKGGIVNLYNSTKQKNLCLSVIVGAGSFTCYTDAFTVDSADVLKLSVGTTQYDCANSNASACQYSQVLANSPQISTATISGNQITLDGSNFPP